jgi:hypothetical protein
MTPSRRGRLKYGRALNYAYRISRLSQIRRPSGTRPFFVCYPGNKLPGYYREVPPGRDPIFCRFQALRTWLLSFSPSGTKQSEKPLLLTAYRFRLLLTAFLLPQPELLSHFNQICD